MKERPILFKADMVNAILEGRKTQTRRIVKEQPYSAEGNVCVIGDHETCIDNLREPNEVTKFIKENIKCPYGKVGDQLWVRETWAKSNSIHNHDIFYKATDGNIKQRPLDYSEREDRWRPSIHMFREDSRIQLEITDIRVERLNDISDVNAKAEGVTLGRPDWCKEPFPWTHRLAFAYLWESINGAGSWDLNPWVWVIEFKRVYNEP